MSFANLSSDVVGYIVECVLNINAAETEQANDAQIAILTVAQALDSGTDEYINMIASHPAAYTEYLRLKKLNILDGLRSTCRALRHGVNAMCHKMAIVPYGLISMRVRFDNPAQLSLVHSMHAALTKHAKQYARIQRTRTIRPREIAYVKSLLEYMPAGIANLRLCRTTINIFEDHTAPIPAIASLVLMHRVASQSSNSWLLKIAPQATTVVLRDTHINHINDQFPNATAVDVSYSPNIISIRDIPKAQYIAASNCMALVDIRNIFSMPPRINTPPTVCDFSRCISLVDVSALRNVKIIRLDNCYSVTDVSSLASATVLSIAGCNNITHTGTMKNAALNITGCGHINLADLCEVGTLVHGRDIVDLSMLPNVKCVPSPILFHELCAYADVTDPVALSL